MYLLIIIFKRISMGMIGILYVFFSFFLSFCLKLKVTNINTGRNVI